VNSPHDLAFPYRPHLLAAILAGALVVALVDPASYRGDRASDAFSIVLVAAAGYGAMRIFVWAAARPLAARWPRLVRAWGLTCFYGAIPLSLVGLFVGTLQLHAVTPNATTIAFVVVAAASMAGGAFPAVRAAAGSSNNRWRGP
jgi:hypothetical protein